MASLPYCPEFANREFGEFVKMWKIEHITSSPIYPQSNGKSENAVNTYKALFQKARVGGKNQLLDGRNTPSEGIGTSPVQQLIGRRTRTLLSTTEKMLRPEIPQSTGERLTARNEAQTK